MSGEGNAAPIRCWRGKHLCANQMWMDYSPGGQRHGKLSPVVVGHDAMIGLVSTLTVNSTWSYDVEGDCSAISTIPA